MEPVFICEFTPTVKMTAARIRKYNKARYVFLLILGIGMFVYALQNAVYFCYDGLDVWWLKFLLFSLAFMGFCVSFPWVNGYFAVKNYKKDTSGTYKIAFDDHIEVTQGTIRYTMEYSDIRKIYHLKYSYELVKSKRLALFVDPNGFTKGNFEDFKRFRGSALPYRRFFGQRQRRTAPDLPLFRPAPS